MDERLLVRRITLCASNVKNESERGRSRDFEQLHLFTDYSAEAEKQKQISIRYDKEKRAQKAIIDIKHKYGRNAILKGMNFEEGATAIDRNMQIGGHKA